MEDLQWEIYLMVTLIERVWELHLQKRMLLRDKL